MELWGKDWRGAKTSLGHVEPVGPPGCPRGAFQRVAGHQDCAWEKAGSGCTRLKRCRQCGAQPQAEPIACREELLGQGAGVVGLSTLRRSCPVASIF